MGIFHADIHGKPVLAFDLIEAFRPWVDRLIIEECLAKNVEKAFFDKLDKEGFQLNSKGKAYCIPLFNDYLRRKKRYNQQQISIKNHIYRYAGQLAQLIKSTVDS